MVFSHANKDLFLRGAAMDRKCHDIGDYSGHSTQPKTAVEWRSFVAGQGAFVFSRHPSARFLASLNCCSLAFVNQNASPAGKLTRTLSTEVGTKASQ